MAEWIRRRTKNLPIFHGTGSSPGVAEQEKEVKFPSMNDLFLGCFGVSMGPTISSHQAFSWSSNLNFSPLKKEG